MLSMTKPQLEALQRSKLEELIELAGSQAHLARMLNVNTTTVNRWVSRGRISKSGALKVESNAALNSHFIAQDLRPDM